MSDLVNLTIDGVAVSVPKGTVVVDAAKTIDTDIPVFCYHPKLKPVGMCRMCLVEIGLPMRNRQTGEIERDSDGNPKVNFRGLQTGCTVEVSEGMVVRAASEVVSEARDDIIEFLLTSHPLDCPICDKGGECPLQNLTMLHGPGTSRFDFEDKMKLAKHFPLGDLIFLDRERCIQCARCTRFQSEIVDDPVIAFHNRGRRLEIVTMSEPGFDSIWSGNTTDICPVGALTTADFRFGARPWELTPVASICPHCPVGCNTTMSTRQEAGAGGRTVVKRIMPRQNEQVNEIWICDKGRFVHHFADSPDRLTKPLIREGDKLVETTWEEALDLVAGRLQMAKNPAALAGDRLSNEDLFAFQKLFRQGLNNGNVDLAYRKMGGGDSVAKVGLSSGSNLKDLAKGDAILVIASDLHQEAPVWWLRVKQAVDRGAQLVVLNVRPTRLDRYASHVVHYPYGQAIAMAKHLLNAAKVDTGLKDRDPLQAAAEKLITAENLVIFYGGEGLKVEESEALAGLLANLLLVKEGGNHGSTRHAGRVNNGLIPVWEHGNTQGAWDMGLRPDAGPGYVPLEKRGLSAAEIYDGVAEGSVDALFIAGADPVGDGLMGDRGDLDFLVVQELFLSESANLADVVLPAQSWAEREGTYTTGERRVQRFYPAIPAVGESRADWVIFSQLGERVGLGKPPFAASLLFREISQSVPQYADMDYRNLARVEEQWPRVGGDDLYYGGTAYDNRSGLGMQWPSAAESGSVESIEIAEPASETIPDLVAISTAALFKNGTLIAHSDVVASRVAHADAYLSNEDASAAALVDGDSISLRINGSQIKATARVESQSPPGIVLIRGINIPLTVTGVNITKDEQD